MADESHPWSPGWPERIVAAARALGYGSLTELLASSPAQPYKEIAERLGPTVAPVQVFFVQYREARAANRVREAAKDSLCRNIVEELPGGWGTGEKSDWKAILALSGWSSEIQVTGECKHLEPVLHAVSQAIRKEPPPQGWLPTGPDDPYLEEVFNRCWPVPE